MGGSGNPDRGGAYRRMTGAWHPHACASDAGGGLNAGTRSRAPWQPASLPSAAQSAHGPDAALPPLPELTDPGARRGDVLMPGNVMDADFRSFARLAMPAALQDGLGVMTMKAFGGGPGVILKSQAATPVACLHCAPNLPTAAVIAGLDYDRVIDRAFEATRTVQPMDTAQVDAVLARTADAAKAGEYELFKTTAHFDETARNAEWLGDDTPQLLKLAPKHAGNPITGGPACTNSP